MPGHRVLHFCSLEMAEPDAEIIEERGGDVAMLQSSLRWSAGVAKDRGTPAVAIADQGLGHSADGLRHADLRRERVRINDVGGFPTKFLAK